jgi:sugar phosphate isomerase/epimerase
MEWVKPMDNFILENETLRLEFDGISGALVGISAIESNWEILNRPHLGIPFRMLVPLSGRRNNPVFGEKQKATLVEMADDKRAATFVWDGVASQHGGKHNIKLTLVVGLTARQAIFSMTIENRSELIVENVYCPYLGDLQHPPNEEWFKTFLWHYARAQEWSLWPTFQNHRGYWGVDFPTQLDPQTESCGTPASPFILLRGANQGLYMGVHAASSELVAWFSELLPGYSSSIDARVPEGQSIADKEVVTRFAAVHVPYILPGETRSLTPIAIEIFQGGWQKGVDIYIKWRNNWLSLPKVPSWVNEPHAWQQIHINSPEDELRMPFRDLVQIGEDCARHGVKAIQLVGWNDGGQDQGNPSHDPDPRLGTFEELKTAISAIKEMGLKVVLFCKFTWADRATERFRKDLIRLAVKDPYGDYYQCRGYQYQTVTQLLDINTKRLIPMCFLSEEYLQVCEQEFMKVLELGADGILFDESSYHPPALLCFDTDHGHRYGAHVYANDRLLIRNFRRLSKPVNDEFLFAGEGCYDWQFEVYHLSYHRSDDTQHIPLTRYMLPHVPLMTAVIGFNDRNMINQCLLYRYIISYEPYNFKGRLDDFPMTVAYGKQMDALRTELRDYFWDGDFRHEIGACVTNEDEPHHPYSVFINRVNGKRGVAIANYDYKESVNVEVVLHDGNRPTRYRLVDDPMWRSCESGIIIPPCSAAVAIE